LLLRNLLKAEGGVMNVRGFVDWPNWTSKKQGYVQEEKCESICH